MRSQLFLSALLFSIVTGSQIANFDIPEDVAAKYSCDATCSWGFSAGLTLDYEEYGDVYDEDFYVTANNFSTSAPGDILKVQPIVSAELSGSVPKGTTAYRFQYTSVDLFGNTVPVSGFIAFPYANRTNGPLFRTVAWAHGTSGVFRGCAPSVMTNLYEYGSWSFLIEGGYAVVATDYAGLGNGQVGHPYVALSAHANDVFYAVVAVRKIFGASLSNEWMSVGHSQGGGTVWSLAESPLLRQNNSRAGRYLGTVAQSPGVFMGSTAVVALEAAQEWNAAKQSVFSEIGWAVIGLQNIYPNETFSWMDPTLRERLELAKLAQACYRSMQALTTDLPLDIPLSSEQARQTISLIDDLSAVGTRKSLEPILVVQGLEDVSVLPQVVESAYNVTCQVGSEVHLQLYPRLGHIAVIAASAPSFLKWMDDRFEGLITRGGCSSEIVKPFDAAGDMYALDDAW
ncbi:hypothetical protein SLS60_011215 [Paraconiothyrium brasiliense]|uniref:Secretory lipase n=1 Tax=Paraconiothyrium brasiliense TaxID=300254 RepID=A0ABR3QLL2_9PLEO